VAAEINDGGGQAAYAHLDVTSEADWEAAVALAVSNFGGLDILVNNAGIGDLAAIEDTSLADWTRTIGVDQTGVFLGMKTAAAALAASGHGSVINISSIFGTSGGFGTSPAYHAAKGAVRTLTKPPIVTSAEIDRPAADATDPGRFTEWQKGVVDGHMDG
jgi:NAD(P)-dependent dehydrogenase (short-subunit alcohol dehydrogenase family)